MTIQAPLSQVLATVHKNGLDAVREAARFALTREDKNAPALRDRRDMLIAGPAGPLAARLYVPLAAKAEGPLILYFHGGGFVIGSIESHDSLCVRLADAAGVRVLSAAYRLAPEAAFPAQVNDAMAVSRWVLDHCAELGADSERLAFGGDSAGGYLAVATTRTLNAERPGTVKAHLLIYPLLHLDDEVWADSVFRESRVIGRLTVRYMKALLAAEPSGVPSLLGLADASTPPTFIISGGSFDPVKPDAQRYAAELEALGVSCEWRQHPRQPHGFCNGTAASKTARQALAETGARVGEFLEALPAGAQKASAA